MIAPFFQLPTHSIYLCYVRSLLVLVLFISNTSMFSQQFAFPSAAGAGAYTTGGRGGIVVKVTNLNDSGTGSLRSALLMTEPRIIVFDVSGTINLNSLLELGVANSNFTVAGQTAPEGGITIAGKPIKMGGGYYISSQPCNNAIWRYIRFRNASYTGESDVYFHNGFMSNGTVGLILDHCSFSFNDDQAISMDSKYGDLTDITIQRCMFSENATGIIAGLQGPYERGDMTFKNNLFVDQSHRTPNVGGALQFDVINNVFFNWKSRLMNSNDDNPNINFIGNYLKEGSYTASDEANKVQSPSLPKIYTAYNYHSSLYPTPTSNDNDLWTNFYGGGSLSASYFSSNQHALVGKSFTIKSANDAFDNVLADVGTNKYLNEDGSSGIYHDSFDTTKISNVINNISTNPYNTNWTLPNIPNNTRPASYDTNNDGMPDVWKISKGFSAATDLSSHVWPSGYIGVEEFLNEIDEQTASNQVNAGQDISICNGEFATLTASQANSYLWNTGETTASITVNPTSTLTYNVTGTHSEGNTTNDNVVVMVNSIPVANAGNDIEICQGASVTLTASGGTSYLWSTGQTSESITVSPNITLAYTVEVSENGCSSDLDEVVVTVNPAPETNAGSDVTINFGETITLTATGADSYLWSTGEITASITVNPSTTSTYSVNGTINNCESTDSVIVFLVGDSVNADAGEDTEICNGNATTLTASGGDFYEWSTGETTQSIIVSPNSTTNYTVIVSNDSSSDTDDVTVVVSPLPEVIISDDVTILESDEYITLSVSGANNYEWSNGATDPNIAVSPNVTTTYVATGYINDCYDVKSVTVNVEAQVQVNAGEDKAICTGEAVTLTASSSGGDDYLWNTGETTQSIVVSPEEDTLYTVIASNSLDSDADEIMVTVNFCEEEIIPKDEDFSFKVYVNSRSSNEILNVKLSGISEHCELYLFDISGKLIHSDVFEGSEGQEIVRTINTSLFSDGVYILKIVEKNNIHSKSLIIR